MFNESYVKSLSQFLMTEGSSVFPVLYPSSSNPHTGTDYYIGASNTISFLYWASVRSGVQSSGAFFSDDDTQYTEEIATFRSAPNVAVSANKATSVSGSEYKIKITYTLTNNSESPITIYKFGVNHSAKGSTTRGASPSSNVTFLAFIHEFNEPIEIPANGIAVVVVELKEEI